MQQLLTFRQRSKINDALNMQSVLSDDSTQRLGFH